MVKVMHMVKGQGHIVGSATIDLLSLHFTFIGSAIPEIQLFKNLTFEIQDQGHDKHQN